MALIRIFFTTSLLLFSLLILVSAGDYGYSTSPEDDNSQSSVYISYVEKSKPEKKDYDSRAEGKGYDFKQHVDKFKPEEEGYGSKTYVDKSKSEQKGYDSKVKSNGYDFKQHVEKFKPEEKGYGAKSEGNGYGSKPYVEKSKPEDKSYDSRIEGNGSGLKPEGGNNYIDKPNDNGYDRKVDFEKSKSVEYHSKYSQPNYSEGYNSKPTSIDFGRKSAPSGY